MTSLTRDVPTESVDTVASPLLRSAAAAGRTVSAKLGQHTDVVFVVAATLAFVVLMGLFGFALL